MQCHAIKLIKDRDDKALWTYVDGKPNQDGILAHILCSCESAAGANPSSCEPPRAHKMTFTLPTNDIDKTCSRGSQLCETPCRQLLSAQNK